MVVPTLDSELVINPHQRRPPEKADNQQIHETVIHQAGLRTGGSYTRKKRKGFLGRVMKEEKNPP